MTGRLVGWFIYFFDWLIDHTLMHPCSYPPPPPHTQHRCPPSLSSTPVTYLSLSEARRYCAWYHKRLPNEWEWQLAAQGTDMRLYPWGDDSPSACAKRNGKACMPDKVGLFSSYAIIHTCIYINYIYCIVTLVCDYIERLSRYACVSFIHTHAH